ncbi:MAG: serine protease [Bacteroidetes bacterium MedPE-SWsnd-G2]|nr:MAG: serine protease [Bacteroidetes bacterium MedPE-SWsnd-G2]
MKKIILVLFALIPFLGWSQEDAWVYFTDKENVEDALANPISILTQTAIDRKLDDGIAIDVRDVPVNESYISTLKLEDGITVLAKSKWFNAVHVRGEFSAIEALEDLTFVASIDYANHVLNASSRVSNFYDKWEGIDQQAEFDYGNSANQAIMLNVPLLHLDDYTGEGVVVAVLDAGFPGVNSIDGFQRLRDNNDILGGYDFVDRNENVYENTTSNHGTKVLSNMGGYIEGEFVGTAPDASFYLFRTEDATSENPVEESYWVEAAERADSLGVDIINSSLGYTVYNNSSYSYTPADMNGVTAYISKGANIAAEKGILVVNSAGNSGANEWNIVGAPADAELVFSIGAVDAVGDYAWFSSVGDGNQPILKPDVVARGVSSAVIDNLNDVVFNNGTSFSAPILAGGIASLWQALPELDAEQMKDIVRQSASQYDTPDFNLGHGIPDLYDALQSTLSLNDVQNDVKINVFPNPVTTHLTINFSPQLIGESIKVINILGKEIYAFKLKSTQQRVDVSWLSSGMYFLKIESPKFTKTIKLLKQ